MIGTVIGNYKVTEKLGEGGMGAVYLGIDLMLERDVAIKMLRPELASQPQVVERFRSEAVTLAKLNHPNIATLYSFQRQGDDYFMVMEFVRGETLDAVIRKTGAMQVDRAVILFCQALEGIDHAHRLGIIHRDIKPANIMLTDDGALKVMDFGIARVLGSARMTKQGSIVGTIEYMSPEQIKGQEGDARSDIYSLGILLYELLTGRLPFSNPSEYELMRAQIEEAPTPPRTFASHLSIEVEQAIMRSLAKKPDARYRTAGEFRGVLLQAIGLGTAPLEPGAPVYSAPATRLMDAAGGVTPSGEITPATRLATGGGAAQPAVLPGETRLAASAGIAPGETPETRLGTIGAPPAHPPVRRAAAASILARLGWVHYSVAAVLLLAVVGLPAALMISGGDDEPVVEQQVPEAVETPPPPQQVDQAAPNPDPTETPVLPGVDGRDASREASSRSRGTSGSGGTETPGASEPTEPAPQSPAAAPVEEKPQVAKEPLNQPPAKPAAKEEEKKGVGGFFKKLNPFKGSDKDKKDDKKKEKKP